MKGRCWARNNVPICVIAAIASFEMKWSCNRKIVQKEEITLPIKIDLKKFEKVYSTRK
jgi:hypothetical protein